MKQTLTWIASFLFLLTMFAWFAGWLNVASSTATSSSEDHTTIWIVSPMPYGVNPMVTRWTINNSVADCQGYADSIYQFQRQHTADNDLPAHSLPNPPYCTRNDVNPVYGHHF
jgi:hypothetical protein